MFEKRRVFIAAAAAFLAAAVCAAAVDAAEKGAEKAAEAAKLVGVLQSNASEFDKAKACQQLAAVGDRNAVPALASLLTHPVLAHYARFGLEAIPDASVDEALRTALGKTQGKLLVGVIHSIGVRQDAKAVELLGPLLKHADPDAATAAAASLGRIGNAPAAALLSQTFRDAAAEQRARWADPCLTCGEQLAARGLRAEATTLYTLLWEGNLPLHQRIAAFRGLVNAKQAEGIPLVVTQLSGADFAMFHAALRLVREVSGPEATRAFLALRDKLAADRRALLIEAIGDRRDPAALPVLLEEAGKGAPSVRPAALKALRYFRDQAASQVLFEAACGADAASAQVAQEVLDVQRSPAMDAEIVARLNQADPKVRLPAIEMAGRWQLAAAVESLWKASGDAEESVRLAAIGALGRTVGVEQLPRLIGRMIDGKTPKEVEAARNAVKAAGMRIPDRNACAVKLTEALQQTAAVPAKRSILELLVSLGGSKALETVVGTVKTGQPELRDLAIQSLGAWKTPDAADALLELAKGGTDEKYRVRALRGYLRIARQFNLPADRKTAMFREAMQLATRDDERRLALEVLTRIPSPETLTIALSYLDQAGLKEKACEVGVRIGERIVESQPGPAVEGMNRLLKAGLKQDLANRAKVVLDRAKKKPAK